MKDLTKRLCVLFLAVCMLFACLPALTVNVAADVNEDAADRVQEQINSISELGEITLEDEDMIRAIRDSYNAHSYLHYRLDDSLLINAEARIRELRDEKIEHLKTLLASLPNEITLVNEAVVTEAMEIFNWMYQYERPQVDYVTVLAANKALIVLQKDAASEVDTLIIAIGYNIDRSSKDSIEAARLAYDALTPGSKIYVKNLTILEMAEATLEKVIGQQAEKEDKQEAKEKAEEEEELENLGLQPETVTVIVIAAVVVVLMAAAFVTILVVIKRKKTA